MKRRLVELAAVLALDVVLVLGLLWSTTGCDREQILHGVVIWHMLIDHDGEDGADGRDGRNGIDGAVGDHDHNLPPGLQR